MKKKFFFSNVVAIFTTILASGLAFGDANTKKNSDIGWVESTEFKFDGKIDFQQDKLGTMDELIAKYKKGKQGVKIFNNRRDNR